MAALNDNQSKELCKKIEQSILKNGYFIFDTDDWDGLHIAYKPFTHGKNYEYADYTEITVTLDSYNVTDKLQVKYNFIKSVYVGRTCDSYRVYYKRENGEKDGGRPYSMNEAAEFIANRFIGLVEDKIMDKKLEARIARLERLIKNEEANMDNKLTLEQRIARLENLTSKQYSKNEALDNNMDEIKTISSALIQVLSLLRNVDGIENRADFLWAKYNSKLDSYL